jgi:ADP-ribosyl-[dinitrogen reductase] hydrolase
MNTPIPARPSPLRNSYWVIPGKVLAGEHPNGTTVEATRDRLQRLMDAGVECFIDLTEPGEVRPYDPELPFSVEYLRKPVRDHGIPAQRAHMAEILDCIHDALQSGRCVYIHCRAGIGRTGTVVGCFLVERGLEGEAALDELNRLWQHCERSQSWASIPETDDQVGYVRKWKARAVFAEELSLASVAARQALVGKGDSTPGSPTTGASATPGEKGLLGLGVPLLDDDDDTSDFERFNNLTRTPSASTSGGTTPPAVQPTDWPSFSKQPAADAHAAASPSGTSAKDAAATRRASADAPVTPSGAATPGATPTRPSTSSAPHVGVPATARESTPNTTPFIATSVDDPLSDPAALSAARNLRDRFLGALLGLAVGDAVSAATQYRKPGTFTPVGDMIGGGPFDLPRGGWTDDTAMALCLADSLLERNGPDPRDQMERYRRWQQEGYLTSTGQCVGITASTARAIAMSAWRRGALFGSHDPAQLDPEPLSRVAPAVMFFFAASGQAVDQATEAARTTCQAPAVLDACRSLARALHAALSGQPKAIVLEKAVQAIGSGPSGLGPGRTATSISASAALTAAVAAFAATANFRDAILYAANLGGDSDVITAVCGQLAGAYYSVKAIPPSWHNGLMQKELITSYADRLLAHAMLGLSG